MPMSQTTRIVEDHTKLVCPRNLTAEQRCFVDIGGWRTFCLSYWSSKCPYNQLQDSSESVSTDTYLCAMLEYIDALFWEHRLSSVEQTKDDNRIRRLAIGLMLKECKNINPLNSCKTQ